MPPRRSDARAVLAWVLAVALCLAGVLGQMHRVLHAPGLADAQAHGQAGHPEHDHPHHDCDHDHGPDFRHPHGGGHGHAHAHTPHEGHGGWLALFGEHDEADCRLYDQASSDPALPGVALLALPVQLPMARLRGLAGDFIARWVALFDARGPPPSR